MKPKPLPSAPPDALRRRAEAELRVLGADKQHRPTMAKPSRRVATQLVRKRTGSTPTWPETDPQRLLHELQVHQIELEMQNTELQEARNRLEGQLEKYTDLYDFAPVGYFSLDEQGFILEVNLTGAALLGVERSRLINTRLSRLVAPASQPGFLAFLKNVFAGSGNQDCEAELSKAGGSVFWARFRGTFAISVSDPRKWCRVSVSDITTRKRAEAAQRRVEVLAASNQKLEAEIIRRVAGEAALKQSEKDLSQSLAKASRQQEELRLLTRQVLSAQEEERKHISRELHDVVAQTLTGINIRLAALKKSASFETKALERDIARTQKLVEHSVDIVHQFARDLRPAVLDDLGLIPALHSFMKVFTGRTGVRTYLTAFSGVEQLDITRRTVLYRVAQEALTNVGRHAKANRVKVTIQKLQTDIVMKISDDGKSFGVEETLRANMGKRLGLLGMRERLEMVGGQFGIKSEPGKGTTIVAQIPFSEKTDRRKL